MTRFTCILGGLLLGVAYGAFTGGLLGNGVVAFGGWIAARAHGANDWAQKAWMMPYWFSLFGSPVGGLAGGVFGARYFRRWERKQSVQGVPPPEALPEEQTWPPPPRRP